MAVGTVLVLEGDWAVAQLLRAALEGAGYRVLSAQDAHGLADALLERPDLVLLSTCLPGLDAAQVGRRLRAGAATARIPIIAMSAGAGDPLVGRLGADACIARPVHAKELRAAVRRWLPRGGVPPAQHEEAGRARRAAGDRRHPNFRAALSVAGLDPEDALTADEVAALTGIAPRTVSRHVRLKRLRTIRVWNRRVTTSAWLRAWLEGWFPERAEPG